MWSFLGKPGSKIKSVGPLSSTYTRERILQAAEEVDSKGEKDTKVTSKTCINTMATNQLTSVKNLSNIMDKLVFYWHRCETYNFLKIYFYYNLYNPGP